MPSASFDASVQAFRNVDENRVVGLLACAIADTGITTQYSRQNIVWKDQVLVLKNCFNQLSTECTFENWHIVLEYEVPRRQKRLDAIILAHDRILVIEFKFGMKRYDAAAKWQVGEYALNLRDFHAASQGRYIVPILCAADAPDSPEVDCQSDWHLVAQTHCANHQTLGAVIQHACTSILPTQALTDPINPVTWLASAYRPTLTIIEAAERLYAKHSVREISHNYAENLDKTTDMLLGVIHDARTNQRRVICFITGVPGAGKTLTGLNIVHDPAVRSKHGPSGIFLSGNGPLVKVMREALVLNRLGKKRKEAEHEVSTFIQNLHQFLRYYREDSSAVPHEHVVVFDEAQRAWDSKQMQRKQGVDRSESDLLLAVMERPADWAVIIALVGGGQEIFRGEAGLTAWGDAIQNANATWKVVVSPEVLGGGQSVAGHKLFANEPPKDLVIQLEPLAHLAVSVRSHRAQQLTEWVNMLLELKVHLAIDHVPDTREFPLVVTRDLAAAREWLRTMTARDPIKRCGLVCASGDQRLRAHGLENASSFRSAYPFDKWFLAPCGDVRSSYALEVPASEFECQGLELDWVGLCWGGDLTPTDDGVNWEHRKFIGEGWRKCHNEVEQAYLRNRYRVLLTRARAGMVIWVPPGSPTDPTRDPARFDRLYMILKNAGVPDLSKCNDP